MTALAKPFLGAVTKMNTVLSDSEVEHRVAVLKRFRELLSQQRDRFRQYLEVLDKQKDVIENGNAGDLISHVELEESIVGDIFAIQKVIDPLEDMYRAAFPLFVPQISLGKAPGLPKEVRELPGIRQALEELKAEAVIRSNRNRELLAKRMTELRHEMKALRSNPYAIHRPAYSLESPAMVDIQG